jgi:hypothetical protein
MKLRSKEEMREYQRLRRKKTVTPFVTPPDNVTPVTPKAVTPCNTVCMGCKDRDTKIFILRGRVELLEKELRLRPPLEKKESVYRF